MLPTATDADPVTRIGAIVALHVLVHAESAHPCLCHDLARYACFSRLESAAPLSLMGLAASPRSSAAPNRARPGRRSVQCRCPVQRGGTPASLIAIRSWSL